MNVQSLDEPISVAKCQYLMGKLALNDSNFIEARQYALSAQRTPVDELFWYKCVCLLSDAHRLDQHADDRKDAYTKSLDVLAKAMQLVDTMRAKRPNKTTTLDYIQAMLGHRLATHTSHALLNGLLNEPALNKQQATTSGQPQNSNRKLRTLLNSTHASIHKRLLQVCAVRAELCMFVQRKQDKL